MVAEDAVIITSSVPDNKYLKKMIKEEIETDIYSYQDFEKDNFIELSPGQNTLGI